MKAAAIYARVSTADQADNGTSLESQVAACQKYAEQNGYTVIATFKEQKSGATLNRPQLDQVRELARHGDIEAVIFYALDRLSRDETDTLILAREWRTKGVELRCATVPLEDTPQGQFLLTMLAAVGKLERAGILERTMRGKRQSVRNGKLLRSGQIPFGYIYCNEERRLVDGKEVTVPQRYEINEDEAYWVRKIFHWYCAEGLSLLEVTYNLRNMAVPTRLGGKWGPATVRTILANEAYTGEFYWGKRAYGTENGKKVSTPRPRSEWIGPVRIPAIISPDLFERAQERVEYNKINCQRRCSTPYLLRGMIVCELCGRRLAGDKRSSNKRSLKMNSGLRIYYACSNKHPDTSPADRCKAARVNGDRAEEKVWNWVIERLSNPALLMELLQSNDADRAQRERDEADMRQLMGLRLDLEREERKWSNAYLNDAISVDKLREYNRDIEERRAGIDRNASEIEARQTARAQAVEDMKAAMELVRKIQRNLPRSGKMLSFEDKRALLDALHVKVTAKANGDVRVTATISEDLLMFTTAWDGDDGDIMGHETEAYEQSQTIRE